MVVALSHLILTHPDKVSWKSAERTAQIQLASKWQGPRLSPHACHASPVSSTAPQTRGRNNAPFRPVAQGQDAVQGKELWGRSFFFFFLLFSIPELWPMMMLTFTYAPLWVPRTALKPTGSHYIQLILGVLEALHGAVAVA